MIKNYLKIALRNILRHKGYTFINLAGLTVGLSAFILIFLYVRYELNYESQHQNADRIYRVNVRQEHPNRTFTTIHSMVPLGQALKDEVPEVLGFTRFYNGGKTMVEFEERKFYEDNIMFTDADVLEMFTLPVVKGNRQGALSNKYSAVITGEIATKYFGDQDPVGKSIVMYDGLKFTVSAVIKNPPKDTRIRYNILLSFETLKELGGTRFMDNWISTNLLTYLLLPETVSLSGVERKINLVQKKYASAEVKKTLQLENFKRLHLYSQHDGGGDIRNIYMFLLIGALILLIACINFMNLSTARSANRANEVGMRKVVGATRFQLVRQFFGESILMSCIALVAAVILVSNILPLFRNLTGQDLSFPGFADFYFYGLIIVVALVSGIIAGIYPAVFMSRFRPVKVLKGMAGSGIKSAGFRKALVLVQFSIAIVLIICTLMIRHQIDFMRHKNLGFQSEHMVIIPVQGDEVQKNIETFKENLLQNSNISGATASILLPNNIGFYNNVTWEGAQENESVALIQNKIDYDFLDTYNIKLLKGRNFSPDFPSDVLDYKNEVAGAVLLNEEAVRRFGWKDPVGKKVVQVYGNKRSYLPVIGVVEDFHFSSLRTKIRPLSLFLKDGNYRRISVRIQAHNIPETIAFIEETWKKINPQFPFEYSFLDESLEKAYRAEQRLNSLFGYFSLLAIFISCLGLFGLASFAAEQRRKEIGVRKVLGASVSKIVLLFSKDFTSWVLLANIIAWPVAALAMYKWLEGFAYRVDLKFSLFIIAGVLALIIALATVGYQAVKAATSNPVKALHYE